MWLHSKNLYKMLAEPLRSAFTSLFLEVLNKPRFTLLPCIGIMFDYLFKNLSKGDWQFFPLSKRLGCSCQRKDEKEIKI